MEDEIPFDPVHAPIEDAYRLSGTRPERLEYWDRHVIVDVIHDGARVPPFVEPYFDGNGALRAEVHDAFVRERDWGAAAVADRLAYHLGLRGYYAAQTARVVCDYNRFRGRSVPEAGHLGRRALFPPGSNLLSPELGEQALAQCYDAVSEALFARAQEAFEHALVPDSRLLRITVHTYDDRALLGGRRPKTSLIFTPFEYHESSRLPANVYVPVFPDRLAEFTADRALAYRMALLLEKNYLPVAVNSPYFLPLGGAEMRLQVWCYIQHLRQQVALLEPDLAGELDPLWPVLNHVDVPWGGRELEPESLDRLHTLTAFVKRHERDLVHGYRYAANRPSAIEVEVRKDILWQGAWQELSDGSEAFVPERGTLRHDEVDRIARVLATGVRMYLNTDQPEKQVGGPGS